MSEKLLRKERAKRKESRRLRIRRIKRLMYNIVLFPEMLIEGIIAWSKFRP